MLIDAHTHIVPDDSDITILYNSVTAEDWERIPSSPQVIPFYGIHPWYAKSCSKIELMALGQSIKEKKAAGIQFGIGETGLDKTDRNPDFEDQKGFFAFHLWLPSSIRCLLLSTVSMPGALLWKSSRMCRMTFLSLCTATPVLSKQPKRF